MRGHSRTCGFMPDMQTHRHTLIGVFLASSICKGEVFAGYVARHNLRALEPLHVQLLGRRNASLPWLLPTRLQEHVPILGDRVGSLESVLTNNTLVPGFNRFLSAAQSELMHRHHIGTEVAGLTAKLGLMSSRHRDLARSVWGPAICLDCLEDDIAPTGDPFWRRDLLMRHIRVCPRHSTPVYDLCGTCLHGFSGSITLGAPRSRCVCGGPLKQRERHRGKTMERLEFSIARGWHRLLDADFAPHAQGQLIAAIASQKAREIGVTKGRQVKWEQYTRTFMSPAIGKLGDSLRFPFKSRRVSGFLLGETTLRNPFHALFVLLAMFGSWEEIESVLSATTSAPDIFTPTARPAMHRNSPEDRARRLGQSIQLLPQTCQLYESLRSTHPYLSHTGVRDQLPYMNALAATKGRLRAHGVHFPEGDISQVLDASGAAHIERQAQTLIRAGVAYRLSRMRLLKDHPLRNSWQHKDVRARSPKTAAALKKHFETWAKFRRRLLPEKIRAGLVPGLLPKQAGEVDNLTDEEVHALWLSHSCFVRRRCRS